MRIAAVCFGVFLLISIRATSQTPTVLFDTMSKHMINFDDTANLRYLHIDTAANNIWQIGTPQKSILSSAYSQPNAIITDTLSTYPVNNHSYFDIALGEFNIWNYPMMISVAFKHRFDTDTLRDGGYVSISWDEGISFSNVVDDTAYIFNFYGSSPSNGFDPFQFAQNIYPDSAFLFNGEPGFSGTSNGWVQTVMPWYIIPVKANPPDTVWLRFNFVSDSIDNSRQGWMIDDILIYSLQLPGSLHDEEAGIIAAIFPNPASQSARIRCHQNHKSILAEVFDMNGLILRTVQVAEVSELEIPLEGLSDGTYLLGLTVDGSHRQTLRLQVIGSR